MRDKQGWKNYVQTWILLVSKSINYFHFVAKIYQAEINFEVKIQRNIFLNRNIHFFDWTWGKPNP